MNCKTKVRFFSSFILIVNFSTASTDSTDWADMADSMDLADSTDSVDLADSADLGNSYFNLHLDRLGCF